MPVVSVLTAVHPSGSAFLREAAESILTQRLPEGWELEWILQEDGTDDLIVQALLPQDGRIKYESNGGQLGAALTRNLGLRRVQGEFVQNLDADDILLSGALLKSLHAFAAAPDLHWAIGQADDLLPDGSRKSFPPDLPFGRTEPGVVNAWAEAHGGNWPIHCAGLMYRTATLRALGGWGGLPFDEDLAVFGVLSELVPGWFDHSFTWLYRQHPAQMIRSAARDRWSPLGREFVLQRLNAVRALGLGLAGTGTGEGWDAEVSVAASRKDPGTL